MIRAGTHHYMQGFPPMSKYGLQTVMNLASCYGLKASAQGSGKKQFVVVCCLGLAALTSWRLARVAPSALLLLHMKILVCVQPYLTSVPFKPVSTLGVMQLWSGLSCVSAANSILAMLIFLHRLHRLSNFWWHSMSCSWLLFLYRTHTNLVCW